EPKSEPASVLSKLCKWLKQLPGRTRRQPAALILDLDADSVTRCVSVQLDLGARVSEFERVLQQVADCRQEQIAIRVESKLRVNVRNSESALPDLRFQVADSLISAMKLARENTSCGPGRPAVNRTSASERSIRV